MAPLAPGGAGIQSQADGQALECAPSAACRTGLHAHCSPLTVSRLPALLPTVRPRTFAPAAFAVRNALPHGLTHSFPLNLDSFQHSSPTSSLPSSHFLTPRPNSSSSLPPRVNECCTLLQARGAPGRCKKLFDPDRGFLTDDRGLNLAWGSVGCPGEHIAGRSSRKG